MNSPTKPSTLNTVVMLAEQFPRMVSINDRIARLNGNGPELHGPMIAVNANNIYARKRRASTRSASSKGVKASSSASTYTSRCSATSASVVAP